KIADKREGEIFDVNFAFQNISARNFDDTLTVQYTLTNQATRTQTKTYNVLNTLKAGDTLFFSYSINTLGLAGDNNLNVYVNPKILPEQYYNNNILQFPFKVLKDNTHPILDVTFDGIHIMDGDIVSPTTVISISLKDENKYLLKTDTVGIEIFLKEPDAEFFRRVYFSGPEDISWIPAGANNKFKIDYSPENEDKMYLTEKKPLEDGIYTLRVEGADVTGNESGVNPYKINFNVINESTITYFYPYPNPFSTCTRFVFTLTGNDIPDEIKIQIMTVTGKVVREILQDELGALRIGNNITDFQWCGTDEFGDKLANGVYLYRVFARSNGEDIRHRNTAADRGFKRNFGKLYILR
ncbi:MAG: transporter, partial [Bacteroidetes bacterium]|nr:transporter [Bacteroidota bacterium]